MLKQTCLILFSLSVFVTYCFNTNPHDDLSEKVLQALEKVLSYIYENLEDMNVDGLFGVVFTNGKYPTEYCFLLTHNVYYFILLGFSFALGNKAISISLFWDLL